MSLCVHFEMCSTFQKHLFEGDFVPQGRFYFTSIATTHPWVAHICIILINVNIGHRSLAFGPGSACSRQHEKKPLWVGGRAKVYGTQWQPVCRRSSHFPRRISCLLVSHCIDFHAWNSPILKDNVIGALGVKKSAVFSERRRQGWGEGDCGGRRGSPVGYSKTPDTPPKKSTERLCSLASHLPGRAPPTHSPRPLCRSVPSVPDGWKLCGGWASHTSDRRGKDSLFRPRSAGRWMELGILGGEVRSHCIILPQGRGEVASPSATQCSCKRSPHDLNHRRHLFHQINVFGWK